MTYGSIGEFRPISAVATVGVGVLERNDAWLADPYNRLRLAAEYAPGLAPDAQYDLSFFGGKTVQTGTVVPLYVGGSGAAGAATQWAAGDISSIDAALGQALSDSNLETVMVQYFSAQPSMSVGASGTVPNDATTLQQSDVETMVKSEFAGGALTGDYSSTLFCFLLSPGTRLFASDGSDSYDGLGGYHGSVSVSGSGGQQTVYYAAGVYSETTGGVTNGIPAFDTPWKNVVATFYHLINEWRTNPDVGRVTGSNVNGVLGWYSPRYGEIGDIPIIEAGQNLSEVFVEVALASGAGTVPVQVMYSNHDHRPVESTAAQPGSALVGSSEIGASGRGFSDLVFASRFASDSERLSAIDDLWTGYLNANARIAPSDLAHVAGLGFEMQRLLSRLHAGSRRLRALIAELEPDTLEATVRTALAGRPFSDMFLAMLPEGSFGEQVTEACSIVELEAPTALAALSEQLQGLARAGGASGDLPGRLKCAIILAGAGASALGLIIAPHAVGAGTAIGLVGILLGTLATASGWSCRKAGDVATGMSAGTQRAP